MPANVATADCGASAAISGIIALVGELVDAKAIDGRAADRIRDAMLRSVEKFDVPLHAKQPVQHAIIQAFDWAMADGKGGKKG